MCLQKSSQFRWALVRSITPHKPLEPTGAMKKGGQKTWCEKKTIMVKLSAHLSMVNSISAVLGRFEASLLYLYVIDAARMGWVMLHL